MKKATGRIIAVLSTAAVFCTMTGTAALSAGAYYSDYSTFDIIDSDKFFYKIIVPNVQDDDGYSVYDEMMDIITRGITASVSNGIYGYGGRPSLKNGTSVPDELIQGTGITVCGTITSSSKLAAVTVAVYDISNNFVMGETVYPAAKSYDIGELDKYMVFNELPKGTYSYQVIAADSVSDNHILTQQTFRVVSEYGETVSGGYGSGGATLTGGTEIPESITSGQGLAVRGLIKSVSSKLAAVTVGVYDKNNKRVYSKTVYPAAMSYDLSNLDKYILFNQLPPGLYSYQVVAANAQDTSIILSNQTFRVN
ncbi:MAG: hypothetical protein J6B17_00930 [Ruminococcus sp.]|nr:hypothetical protein [Ruminococcus sp.]